MRGFLGVNSAYRVRAGICACILGLVANLTRSALNPPCVTVALELKIHYLYITAYIKRCDE